MIEVVSRWRHVFKLDPERFISDADLERICTSGTDAVIVGGSSGLTYENTSELLERLRQWPVLCALEVSADEVMVGGFDCYFIPVVLNAGHLDWLTGKHQQALRDAGDMIDWDKVVSEGYVILNGDSTVARVTEARLPETLEDLLAYGLLAERIFRLPVLYLEYSGMFGNMEWVKKARGVLKHSRLFYGGGIDSPDKARAAARWADTVIVGNVIYDHIEQAVATVAAVHNQP